MNHLAFRASQAVKGNESIQTVACVGAKEGDKQETTCRVKVSQPALYHPTTRTYYETTRLVCACFALLRIACTLAARRVFLLGSAVFIPYVSWQRERALLTFIFFLFFLSFFLSFLFVVPQLRFKRMGRKKRPFYRLVAIDSRRKREGLALEELGWYNPLTKETYINAESVQKWLSDGAEPSDTVASLLKKAMPTFEAK